VSVDPLLVIFAGQRERQFLAEPPFAGHYCSAGYTEFSDTWDFERTFALKSTLLSHPEWSAKDRAAINAGTVLVGMTKDMVVASVGYPSVYGTSAQMLKLDTWEYVEPVPASFTVKFKNGRVIEYDPPHMLP